MKKISDLSQRIKLAEAQLINFKLIMPIDVKPNFSAVARSTGLSRHTVSKAWNKLNRSPSEIEQEKPRKKKGSKFDPYRDEIIDIIKNPNVNIKAAFKYMQDLHGKEVFSNYSSFKSFIRNNNLMEYREMFQKAHPRFETEAGKQIQFDWKESMKMELDTGEIIEFNLFTAVLGFSRLTLFVYSKTKTEEDAIRCLIEVVEQIGGVPHEFLTDNMAAIVSLTEDRKTRKKHPAILQLEKDLGAPIQLCDPGACQTKGYVQMNVMLNRPHIPLYLRDMRPDFLYIIFRRLAIKTFKPVFQTFIVIPFCRFSFHDMSTSRFQSFSASV